MSAGTPGRLLLTGATGYVGGRLLRVLEDRGHTVRCLVRRPDALAGRMGPRTEAVQGDVYDPASLARALAGVETAYYLIHALADEGDFETREHEAARNFAEAAAAAGVQRIIYLGGLGGEDADLSPHLRSRHEVGRILRQAGVPVIEFRASIIIGSGSLSFELIRALVRRLPVMVAPRWVRVPAQPIAIDDMVAYLVEALEADLPESRVFEVGGQDHVSYGELLHEYARQRGLRRFIIPVPVLTPRLSSLWLHLVTPVYASVGRRLVDSMRHPSVVHDTAALEVFSVRPVGIREAIAQALRNEDREFVETHWADALSSLRKPGSWGGVTFRSRIVDSRTEAVAAPPEAVFAVVRRIGGGNWYYGNLLWQVRGLMDRAVGGVGMNRGRRDPESLRVGDVVDCWRVEAFEEPRRLLLAAEMRMPGRAWLEFSVEPREGGSTLRQTAIFDPVGWFGLAYWYSLYVVHEFVFAGMLRNMARAAERAAPQ